MAAFFQQVYQLLTVPPGNLVYHLVLAFSVVAAFQASLNYWRTSGSPQGRRMAVGLGLLLFAQLVLFASTALVWQELVLSQAMLPVLDRAVALFSLVVIIWLWVFPERTRLVDAATLLLVALVGTALALSLVWTHGEGKAVTNFGLTWLADAWRIGAIALTALGLLVLSLRRPNNWGFGSAMLALILVGYSLDWFFPDLNNNFSGIVRLTQMAAYPLLWWIPQRFPLTESGLHVPTQPVAQAKTRVSSDPKVLQAFLDLAVETSPDKIHRGIVLLVSKLMLADVCLLITSLDQAHQLAVVVGYDLIREQPIDSFALDERLSPVISTALHRGRSVRLPASSTSPDLLALCRALNMGRVGHLLVITLPQAGGSPASGLVLLSPYSNRGWTQEDQNYLANISGALAQILQRSQQTATLQTELTEKSETLENALIRVEKLERENERLSHDLASSQSQSDQGLARAESLAAMLAAQQDAHETLLQVQAENKRLKEDAEAHRTDEPTDLAQMEEELRMTLEEVARLRQELLASDKKWLELESATGDNKVSSGVSGPQSETLASISQDLRQPLSSIIGYTDLLLGESVGILGALQRKFLERIKTSTERMNSLVDEIVQVTTLKGADADHPASLVNLNVVIDEAIASSALYLREKNIALRVDMPETLPKIRSDHDTLQQILLHLLQNAGSVTPANGEITLRARLEKRQDDPGYMLVQVADAGGGIPAEDLPRVFSRLYRAESPAIQGVGNAGVGLSIVKSLVETQGGRIWVDSETGRGATYSVLLPIGSDVDDAGRDGGKAK